jgi:hypothetical protein
LVAEAAGVADVAEPELMSVVPVAEPVVPEAPIEVPLPVVPMLELELEPAVVSVLVPVPVVVEAALLVSDGSVVVDGVVAVEVDAGVDVSAGMVAVSSFLPQALSVRAAIRARAAHCAVGDLIIRNSLWVSFGEISIVRTDSACRCLRLTLVRVIPCLVVCHCRWL